MAAKDLFVFVQQFGNYRTVQIEKKNDVLWTAV